MPQHVWVDACRQALRQTASRQLEINGMYRHGFMIAPALHDAALELFEQGQSPLAEQLQLAAPSTLS